MERIQSGFGAGGRSKFVLPPDGYWLKCRNWIGYGFEPAHKAAFITLKKCDTQRIEEFKQILQEFFSKVMRRGVENLALDLRMNGGGGDALAFEFLRYLPCDTFRTWSTFIREGGKLKRLSYASPIPNKNRVDTPYQGKLFVLTDFNTFSSAQHLTMIIQDNGLGKVIGQHSRNKPDRYGQASATGTLKNSNFTYFITEKIFWRPDRKLKDKLQEPDYPCNPYKAYAKFLELCNP